MYWGPFYQHRWTLIPAWISNYIHNKMWNNITDQIFNGRTVEVWEWINNSTPHCFWHITIYQWWEQSQSILVKVNPCHNCGYDGKSFLANTNAGATLVLLWHHKYYLDWCSVLLVLVKQSCHLTTAEHTHTHIFIYIYIYANAGTYHMIYWIELMWADGHFFHLCWFCWFIVKFKLRVLDRNWNPLFWHGVVTMTSHIGVMLL